MIQSSLFRNIQNQPRLWRIEGFFLVLFGINVVLSLLLAIVLTSWFAKGVVIIIGLISTIILRMLSCKYGIRNTRKIIGKQQQPNLLIATDPYFYFPEK